MGKKNYSFVNTKEKKVELQGVVDEAGQGRGQGTGPKQHAIISLIFLFCFLESLTPPHHQALFHSDWEMQGHQKLEIDHRTIGSSYDRPAWKGMFTTPEYTLQSIPEGRREATQSDQFNVWWGKKIYCDTSVILYARLVCKEMV